MKKRALYIAGLLFVMTVPAQAGKLFPPENAPGGNGPCPAGHMLTWKDSSVYCKGITVPSCPAGKMLTGITNGQPVCSTVDAPAHEPGEPGASVPTALPEEQPCAGLNPPAACAGFAHFIMVDKYLSPNRGSTTGCNESGQCLVFGGVGGVAMGKTYTDSKEGARCDGHIGADVYSTSDGTGLGAAIPPQQFGSASGSTVWIKYVCTSTPHGLRLSGGRVVPNP